jgi:putative intracellular protease/amidase
VDGVSPLAGKTVSAYALSAPGFVDASGSASTTTQQTTRWHVEANGATMVPSRSVGDPYITADDVIVDGRIITAENYDSARFFGRTVAAAVLGQ